MSENAQGTVISDGTVVSRLLIFDQFVQSTNFGTIAPAAKDEFRAARSLVGDVAVDATGLTLGSLPTTSFVSKLCPSGKTTNHYWCCLYPSVVPHKSYGLQVALIVSVRGIELCCCLGGGRSDAQDSAFQAEWRFLKQRLEVVPEDVKGRLAATLDQNWFFKRQWRDDERVQNFQSIDEWLTYAATPEAGGASISRYWTREDLPKSIDDLKTIFRDAVALFGPLFDAVYLNRTELGTSNNGGTELVGPVTTENWLFQANPKIYDISRAVRELKQIDWRVSQYKDSIRKGHRVYLWESGRDAGIIAVATVLNDPAVLPEQAEERKFHLSEGEYDAALVRVSLSIDQLIEPRLRKSELRLQSGLTNLRILKMTQGTNFPVSSAEAEIIDELIAVRPAPGESKDDEFKRLFGSFVDQFLHTPAGQKHIATYEISRAEARQSLENIRAASLRGDDVTEQVVTKLLPHADTPTNRDRAAWVHIAPALSGDVRIKFNARGFTSSEQWPSITNEILRFVERCVNNPSELAAACAEFASNEASKGFGSGMLSPFLNAIRPDAFSIVNKKSRILVNHFAGTDLGHGIGKYPSANEATRRLVERFGPVMRTFQFPPSATDGDLFDMFCHFLVGVKKYAFGQELVEDHGEGEAENEETNDASVQFWKIAPGEDAWNWDACRQGEFISIGWAEFGDISSVERAVFETLRERLALEHNWKSRGMEQVWAFAKKINVGDRIVANQGKQVVLGIGTVIGSYYFVKGERHAHRLRVRWDDVRRRRVSEKGWQRTLVKLDAETFDEILNAEVFTIPDPSPQLMPDEVEPEPTPEINPEYSLQQMADETGHELAVLERWVRSVQRKGQAIFYGPPGTGKTFIAERIGKHLVGGGTGLLEVVQFHPAYSYEDFMQGIRPETQKNGSLYYPMSPGRFVNFCERAKSRTGLSVLIVDEINRANLSRVFGELMYLLEYRDREVPLAGGGKFKIPANVRLIGTMNTADRSIALVDHALRRRFAFLQLYPDYELLSKFHQGNGFDPAGLVEILKKLNSHIGDKHYEVGISFFLHKDVKKHIEDVWRMEIEPYIEEFFFDQPEKVTTFRWDAIKADILG